MKKSLSLLLLLTLFSATLFSAPPKKAITAEVFMQYVNLKVDEYQDAIKFTNDQARQIKKIEFNYLVAVQKAEECFFCLTKKRIRKLTERKYKAIEKLMSKDEYIKYKAIDSQEIKMHPLWAE